LEVIKFDVSKVTMATDAEVARVRAAWIAAGPRSLERMVDARRERVRDSLVRLADAWGQLDIEDRAAVSRELARQVSPPADPHDLDVGLAAYRVIVTGYEDRVIEPDLAATDFGTPLLAKRKRGVREPGFREAVQEAGKVWMERDAAHTWNPGNIHRDDSHYAQTEGWQPSPMLAFVAFTVTRALPVAALRRAANVREVRWVDALRAAHTQLRA
jgi:hypothetical protein